MNDMTRKRALLASMLVAFPLVLGGCGDSSSPPADTVSDAGSNTDGANLDGQPSDTAAADSEVPDTDTPDADTPDTDTPDTDTPDADTPDTDTPDSEPLDGGADSGTLIGPGGGTVVGPDGAEVVVPAGALSTPTAISIVETTAADLPAPMRGIFNAGKLYSFLPHGLTFDLPVTVRVPFDPALVPASLSPILVTAAPAGTWSRVTGATVVGGDVEAQVSHFSVFGDVTTLTFREIRRQCGLTYHGEIWCWGSDWYNNYEKWTEPQKVEVGPVRLESLMVGAQTFCGIGPLRRVHCMGQYNGDGVSTTDTTELAPVDSSLSFTKVSGGNMHFCAIAESTGALFCWGNNTRGQLGNGTTNPDTTRSPTPLAGPAASFAWADVAAGGSHTCAVTMGGDLYCWGDNTYLQLGLGAGTSYTGTPTLVGSGYQRVSASGRNTCVVNGTGLGFCAGDNSEGQIGDGTVGNGYSTDPNQKKTLTPVSGNYSWRVDVNSLESPLQAGNSLTCGFTTSATSYCWGRTSSGAIGNGVTPSSPWQQTTPALIAGGLNFAQLSTWNGTTPCGVTPERVAYCWGDNTNGEMGIGDLGPGVNPTPAAVKVTDLP